MEHTVIIKPKEYTMVNGHLIKDVVKVCFQSGKMILYMIQN